MKRFFSFIFVFLFSSAFIFAQQILTAGSFFQSVSEYYGTIKDYEATINISTTAAKRPMSGRVSFKRPSLLRIDFTNPDKQVLVFNGDMLTIYLPEYTAVLNQSVSSAEDVGAGLATPQGLYLLSRYYTISYQTGQTPVPLDANSEELVMRLLLSRKNTSEGFRTITLSISPETKLIRRIEGITTANEQFIFDYTNYVLNQGIPDQRFIYDPPSAANNYNNFLFAE